MYLSNISGWLRCAAASSGFALALSSAALVGCGAAGDEPGAETASGEATDSAETALEVSYIDGYHYVPSDTDKMYRLYDGNKYCWVYDMGQADALMGVSKSNWTKILMPTEAVFKQKMRAMGRTYKGQCVYPTGCFRRRDSNEIYRVDANRKQFCWLRTDADRNARCRGLNYGGSNFLNIQRSSNEINFFQDGWFDQNGSYHSDIRYDYYSDCKQMRE
jgi:hypothetical protein